MKKLMALALALVLVLTCTCALADKVWANGTPTVYIGYGAGGGTDTAVRPVIAEMAAYLGETINCVNMEGANSAVACDYVLDQPHDGYTFFATGTGGMSSYPVYSYTTAGWEEWLSFHAFSGPAVIIANTSSGIKTTEDVFNYIAGGKNFGIGAYGNGPHTQFESICATKGVAAPKYSLFGSCGDVGVAVIAGDVQVGAASLSAVIDYVNAGLVTPIFVTCANAFEFATGTTPSVTTEVPGTESVASLNETWPILIPRDTPKEIVDKMTEAFLHAIETDAVKDFAASKGYTMTGLYGEEADKHMSYSISGYSWTLFNAGLGNGNPADEGIPTLEEYNWETLKTTVSTYQ